ncbi:MULTISPECIES: serine/threonine-protein kinase [Sorangium]|uniref:Protein kinase n=1 Tax=Sorangium cellulosum TaxID=56 RepID=A0A4P2QGB3_SORCE|nr:MULTISPECIES: serine/threonine-protein kinase [Sorangium]AUX28538.1 protein kinase [Sorangium cellulosum]WCQ87932.1 serine-threonine kinase [Sorangium sp. Soce836]
MSAPSDPQGWRKYRPIAEIGRGGMADVCLAVARGPAGFNKLVVLKRARAELCEDAEILAMFLDEARLAARLNHPNVVQTYEVGEDGERLFIAMEYLDGQPLSQLRARVGLTDLSLPVQVRILTDALAGLHYAHELRDFDGTPIHVVHRDASPQNIFVTYDGVIKVVDFGIAKAADSLSETRAGMLKGKVAYMSPEQSRGERVDRRSDVFSVGVILWEAIARRRMWKGYNDLAILGRLGLGELPDLRVAAPDVDPELERICRKSLAHAPADRYATAAELHAELERWLRERHGGMSAREVGAFVAGRFADDRARIQQLVEEQLRDVRWSGSYGKVAISDLPKIGAGPVSMTPTLTAPAAFSPSDAISTPPAVSSTETGQTRRTGRGERASRSSRRLAAIAITFLLAAGVVAAGILRPPPHTAPAGPVEALTAPPADAPPPRPPPPEEEVRLVVRVSPAEARLFLDGAPLSRGDYQGQLVKDGREHVVRAEAPGFLSQEEKITAKSDLVVKLALERDPGAPRGKPAPIARSTPAIAPAPAATPPPAPPRGGERPGRGIDLESPYAR